MSRVTDPHDLASLFGRDRQTHLYGLADLEEPYWSNSVWHRVGDAVVGLVSAGGDWQTVYAMSQTASAATLDLLAELADQIPGGTWVTGPVGLLDAVSSVRAVRDIGPHWRMILEATPSSDPEVMPLSNRHLDALSDLYESDPGAAFFLPEMLERGRFFGIWQGDELVAAAGTHVVSSLYAVTAVGAVLTRPSHRGRGLAGRVTGALTADLAARYETVGLNVETSNHAAIKVYERIGYRRLFEYEEIELL